MYEKELDKKFDDAHSVSVDGDLSADSVGGVGDYVRDFAIFGRRFNDFDFGSRICDFDCSAGRVSGVKFPTLGVLCYNSRD